MHGRNDSVKFAFKKNLKHVMIHMYVRYKFKEKRMLCSNNRIFNSNLLSHTQIGDLQIWSVAGKIRHASSVYCVGKPWGESFLN
jgi:hypothetical protein